MITVSALAILSAMAWLMPVKPVLRFYMEVDRHRPFIIGLSLFCIALGGFLFVWPSFYKSEPDWSAFNIVLLTVFPALTFAAAETRLKSALGWTLDPWQWCQIGKLAAVPCLNSFSLLYEAMTYGPANHEVVRKANELQGDQRTQALQTAFNVDKIGQRYLQKTISLVETVRCILLANVVLHGGTLTENEVAFMDGLTKRLEAALADAKMETQKADSLKADIEAAKQSIAARKARQMMNGESVVMGWAKNVLEGVKAGASRIPKRVMGVVVFFALLACLVAAVSPLVGYAIMTARSNTPGTTLLFLQMVMAFCIASLFLKFLVSKHTTDESEEAAPADNDDGSDISDETMTGNSSSVANLCTSRHDELRHLGDAIGKLQADQLAWPYVTKQDRSFINAAILEPAARMAELMAQEDALSEDETTTLRDAMTAVLALHVAGLKNHDSNRRNTAGIIAKVMRDNLAGRTT